MRSDTPGSGRRQLNMLAAAGHECIGAGRRASRSIAPPLGVFPLPAVETGANCLRCLLRRDQTCSGKDSAKGRRRPAPPAATHTTSPLPLDSRRSRLCSDALSAKQPPFGGVVGVATHTHTLESRTDNSAHLCGQVHLIGIFNFAAPNRDDDDDDGPCSYQTGMRGGLESFARHGHAACEAGGGCVGKNRERMQHCAIAN